MHRRINHSNTVITEQLNSPSAAAQPDGLKNFRAELGVQGGATESVSIGMTRRVYELLGRVDWIGSCNFRDRYVGRLSVCEVRGVSW